MDKTSKASNIIPLILCGGTGSRLWPLSRDSLPKQYLSLSEDSKESFLQSTLKRFKNINSINKPIIICNNSHRFITAEQIREINFDVNSIILEPFAKNTAPAITIAAIKAIQEDNDPILLVLPSDHVIKDNLKFLETVEAAVNSAEEGELVTFGIPPNGPETGYGYIQSSMPFKKNLIEAYTIEKFIEKPNKELAQKLILDKKYSWNSGIFLFKASTVLREIERYCPQLITPCQLAYQSMVKDMDFLRIDSENFKKCESISIDKAIMEKTCKATVYPLFSSWSDIGSWQSFWENANKNKSGNVLIGDSLELKSHNNLIISNSKLVFGLGIDDLIIIETNDAVLVAKKKYSQEVKTVVNYLNDLERKEGKEHKKVYRPWGNYISIESGPQWKVKRIEVKSGESLSLQMHHHRTEHWIVVIGTAKVELDNKEFILQANQSCFVPIGSKHRLTNPGQIPLVIIEVQSGSYLEEDDIVRFNDIYGRHNSEI